MHLGSERSGGVGQDELRDLRWALHLLAELLVVEDIFHTADSGRPTLGMVQGSVSKAC